MKRHTSTLLATAVAGLVALPGALQAQESTTRGFMLGAHLSGASLAIESEDRNGAGGGGLTVGYGLNRNITLLVQLDGAQFDEQSTGTVEGDWRMGHVDFGVRYSFANSLRRWVPYLQGAFGYRSVSVQDPVVDNAQREEVEISGGGLTLGGGVDIYFAQTFALDIQLLWTGGEFSTLRVDNVSATGFDVDATSARFNLGVAWWP
ncbi:MAG: outer membrane beta-barrel protein [Gemmatimonadetes bacterium]|nr:outer membrane beta-barrel protein [Gemmatimonadota bacterium]NNF14005.1 outer membrane beta-barrel protein [Gemmatimonadota bacterium]